MLRRQSEYCGAFHGSFRRAFEVITTMVVVVALVSSVKAQSITEAEVRAALQRIEPLEPSESKKQFEFHEGFRIELAAAENVIRDPVAAEFDEFGRLYVVELPGYNGYAIEGTVAKGSIRRLEDRDHDGQFETSVVFSSDLRYPTAIACWNGGLLVGDSPDLLYLKDTTGDGQADAKTVLLTGFGSDRAGEAHLNSFRWGLDHRFHVSTSLSGGDVRAVENAKPGSAPLSVRGRTLIIDPHDPASFERSSGAGQHGFSMDDWGHRFVCSNSVPAQMLMCDDRYLARTPQLKVPPLAVDIAPDGKFTRLFRISPAEPWRAFRTKLRSSGRFRGSDEGGRPFGFFTGATGITVYRGDAWPGEFRGNLIVGDVANNIVYRARLDWNGLQPTAIRADEGQEFLASRDIWFRPVQFTHGPDGCLYVIDMYRELIEGAAFLPPEFLEVIDPVSGNDRGRIYRIAPASPKDLRRLLPGAANPEQLAKMLAHTNGWHRDTAARLLYERRDSFPRAEVERVALGSSNPIGRVTAAWVLHAHGCLNPSVITQLMEDDDARVRQQGVRLAESRLKSSAELRAMLPVLANDPDAEVRRQVALSVGEAEDSFASPLLVKLALSDCEQEWIRLAILSSCRESAGRVFSNLLRDKEFRKRRNGRRMLGDLAEQIGASSNESDALASMVAVKRLSTNEKELKSELIERLLARMSVPRRERLGDKEGESLIARITERALQVAIDGEEPIEERVHAIKTLRLLPFGDARERILQFIAPTEPLPIREAALNWAGEYREQGAGDLVRQQWKQLGPRLRVVATEVLSSRNGWLTQFLDAIQQGQIPRSEVDMSRMALWMRHPNERIRELAGQLSKQEPSADRTALFERYREAVNRVGNIDTGRTVFRKNCAQCHRLEKHGHAIGAELNGIAKRGRDSVLLNILDPNREVKPVYVTYIVVQQTGRVVTGMIVSENANSITIQTGDQKRLTIQRADIDQMKSTGLSFMPEGLEKVIGVDDMTALLTYLEVVTADANSVSSQP